ncbi:MAPEG family protein [Teredinibacter waterburyi]|uniref:MAPEG family protein n=1 Tax=Teredinibacter waterburyi TaxID=1500538 RepID=UPI00165FE7BD|nr:MAPEG family protein [Teredinibacter waterburyi]
MIYPMFAMILLTTIVAVIAVSCRFNSVKSGSVPIKYYRLMQGDKIPEVITKTTRCVNNMFEVPMLFYVVSTLYIALHIESLLAIILSSIFVGLRCVQAYIHLTYNNVVHRMLAFWFGLICVLLLWVNLLVLQM